MKMREGNGAEMAGKVPAREIEEETEGYNTKKSALTGFVKGAVISEVDYRNLDEEFEELITVGMGATAISKILSEIDL